MACERLCNPACSHGRRERARRVPPTRIDQRQSHRLKRCPHCEGPLQRCRRKRTRIIEDIPEDIQPLISEHTLHRDDCPKCKKHVESVVPDALPNAAFGHRLISFTSWCHYGLGLTIEPLIDVLQFHLQTKLPSGGDSSQERSIEPLGARRADAGGVDERVPHAASARPRPAAHDRRRTAHLPENRSPPAATARNHCRRLNCYDKRMTNAARHARASLVPHRPCRSRQQGVQRKRQDQANLDE